MKHRLTNLRPPQNPRLRRIAHHERLAYYLPAPVVVHEAGAVGYVADREGEAGVEAEELVGVVGGGEGGGEDAVGEEEEEEAGEEGD